MRNYGKQKAIAVLTAMFHGSEVIGSFDECYGWAVEVQELHKPVSHSDCKFYAGLRIDNVFGEDVATIGKLNIAKG